jgi:two-component system OmpR family sensor kinase
MSTSGTAPTTGRRSWKPKSLSTRLLVVTVALVALVGILVAVATTLVLRSYLLGRLDDQLMRGVALIQGAPGGPGGDDTICTISLLPIGPPNGQLSGNLDTGCHQVVAYTGDGPTGYQTVSDDNLAKLDSVPIDGSAHTVSLSGLGRYRVVVASDGAHVVVSGLPTQEVDATVQRLVELVSIFVILGIAGAAAAGWLAVRRQLAPLREVAATAQEVTRIPLEVGAVGVTARVPAELTDPETEVGQVGEALNRMLSHVESALDARHQSEQHVRQFVADASHELRTPLSTIQGYAELSLHNPAATEETMLHAMGRVETESARMTTLVDDLLLLARLDSGRPLERGRVDLSLLVVEAVNDARVVDSERAYKLALPDDPVVVVGDEERLHQVIGNLLSNVRRHTPPGTTVTVSADLVSAIRFVRLSVHDDGPGLPESLRGMEFERFTRGDTSRTRDSGGAGLGLSIVRAIVAAHGGAVAIDSEPGNTSVMLTLPTA